MSKHYVYGIFLTSDLTPVYIGMGSGGRMSKHLPLLKRGAHHSIHLQRKFDKMGDSDKFVALKIEGGLTQKAAIKEEIRLIKYIGRKSLCNMTDGGDVPTNLNEESAERKRLKLLGTGSGGSKLREEDVLYIRASNMSGLELRDMFKLKSHVTIWKIRTGRTWPHVGGKIWSKEDMIAEQSRRAILSNQTRVISESHREKASHIARKLTDDQVREIRKQPHDLKRLAEEYGVSSSTIWNVQSGKTYKRVK